MTRQGRSKKIHSGGDGVLIAGDESLNPSYHVMSLSAESVKGNASEYGFAWYQIPDIISIIPDAAYTYDISARTGLLLVSEAFRERDTHPELVAELASQEFSGGQVQESSGTSVDRRTLSVPGTNMDKQLFIIPVKA